MNIFNISVAALERSPSCYRGGGWRREVILRSRGVNLPASRARKVSEAHPELGDSLWL